MFYYTCCWSNWSVQVIFKYWSRWCFTLFHFQVYFQVFYVFVGSRGSFNIVSTGNQIYLAFITLASSFNNNDNNMSPWTTILDFLRWYVNYFSWKFIFSRYHHLHSTGSFFYILSLTFPIFHPPIFQFKLFYFGCCLHPFSSVPWLSSMFKSFFHFQDLEGDMATMSM